MTKSKIENQNQIQIVVRAGITRTGDAAGGARAVFYRAARAPTGCWKPTRGVRDRGGGLDFLRGRLRRRPWRLARRAPGFTFSLKLPREITHEQALRGAARERALAEFWRGRGVGAELAVLVQPRAVRGDAGERERAAEFLKLLPEDLRFASSCATPSFERTCSRRSRGPHVSLALVEGPWVTRERMWRAAAGVIETTAFAYLRWMGARDLTRFDTEQRPLDANLRLWARAAERLSERLPRVYAYFSNFYEGHAPSSANKLKRLLGQDIVEPDELEDQPTLF